jgi:phytoene dehydrogenase-like protein
VTSEATAADYDAVVVGGGHNGLVAACYLAAAGRSVLVLERAPVVGGAAVSAEVFPGVDARLSRYAYLVGLFPRRLLADLGLGAVTARRAVSSYTPRVEDPREGLLVPADDPATFERQVRRFTGSSHDFHAWGEFYADVARVAAVVFPTLTGPLPSREELRAAIGAERLWRAFFERPLGEVVEERFRDDTVRGVVLTDALIGTFTWAWDPSLRQNRCFLAHTIGNGDGRWDVPVGGMGRLTAALSARAVALGARILVEAEVLSVEADGRRARVTYAQGGATAGVTCRHVLAGVAPEVLAELTGDGDAPGREPADAGAQLKVNMLLRRLPRLRDPATPPERAFAGTFHVNETYAQLDRAYDRAAAGAWPDPVPVELYCHTLTDPTILGPQLRRDGAHTLTAFALHLPDALFRRDNEAARARALRAVLTSLDAVLAEPVEDCLYVDAQGRPCIEASTTVDLEAALALPTGNIFHTPLGWPFAEDPAAAGSWGVETEVANLWLCGSAAQRGGAVSGIPGHNAAMAVLERWS